MEKKTSVWNTFSDLGEYSLILVGLIAGASSLFSEIFNYVSSFRLNFYFTITTLIVYYVSLLFRRPLSQQWSQLPIPKLERKFAVEIGYFLYSVIFTTLFPVSLAKLFPQYKILNEFISPSVINLFDKSLESFIVPMVLITVFIILIPLTILHILQNLKSTGSQKKYLSLIFPGYLFLLVLALISFHTPSDIYFHRLYIYLAPIIIGSPSIYYFRALILRSSLLEQFIEQKYDA